MPKKKKRGVGGAKLCESCGRSPRRPGFRVCEGCGSPRDRSLAEEVTEKLGGSRRGVVSL